MRRVVVVHRRRLGPGERDAIRLVDDLRGDQPGDLSRASVQSPAASALRRRPTAHRRQRTERHRPSVGDPVHPDPVRLLQDPLGDVLHQLPNPGALHRPGLERVDRRRGGDPGGHIRDAHRLRHHLLHQQPGDLAGPRRRLRWSSRRLGSTAYDPIERRALQLVGDRVGALAKRGKRARHHQRPLVADRRPVVGATRDLGVGIQHRRQLRFQTLQLRIDLDRAEPRGVPQRRRRALEVAEPVSANAAERHQPGSLQARRHVRPGQRQLVGSRHQRGVGRGGGQPHHRVQDLLDIRVLLRLGDRLEQRVARVRRPAEIFADRRQLPEQDPPLGWVGHDLKPTCQRPLEAGVVLGAAQQADPSLEEMVRLRPLLERHRAILRGGCLVADDLRALGQRVQSIGALPGAQAWQHPLASVEHAVVESQVDRVGEPLLVVRVDLEEPLVELQDQQRLSARLQRHPRRLPEGRGPERRVGDALDISQHAVDQLVRLPQLGEDAVLHPAPGSGGWIRNQAFVHEVQRALGVAPAKRLLCHPETLLGLGVQAARAGWVHAGGVPQQRVLRDEGALSPEGRALHRVLIIEERVELFDGAVGSLSQALVRRQPRDLAIHAARFGDATEPPAEHIPALRQHPRPLLVVTGCTRRQRQDVDQLRPLLAQRAELGQPVDRRLRRR